MGIWRVLSGKVYCDNCGSLVAYIEFDANDEPNIERVRVVCLGCHKSEEATPTDKKEG